MKNIALVALALASVPLTAAAQDQDDLEMDRSSYDVQVQDLHHRSQQLGSDIARSRTALALIAMDVFEERGTARLTVVQENRMGALYRLVSATYAIDGAVVFTQAGGSGALEDARELEIYAGAITPGEHVLTVRLEYTGDGGGVVSYLEGYRFVIRSAHHFTAAEGRALRVRVIPFEREAYRAFTDRPWIGYRESLRD